MSIHDIARCRDCGTTISQCRCPSNEKEVRWGRCLACEGLPVGDSRTIHTEADVPLPRPKCDGDHAMPACPDPECWQTPDSEPPFDSDTDAQAWRMGQIAKLRWEAKEGR